MRRQHVQQVAAQRAGLLPRQRQAVEVLQLRGPWCPAPSAGVDLVEAAVAQVLQPHAAGCWGGSADRAGRWGRRWAGSRPSMVSMSPAPAETGSTCTVPKQGARCLAKIEGNISCLAVGAHQPQHLGQVGVVVGEGGVVEERGPVEHPGRQGRPDLGRRARCLPPSGDRRGGHARVGGVGDVREVVGPGHVRVQRIARRAGAEDQVLRLRLVGAAGPVLGLGGQRPGQERDGQAGGQGAQAEAAGAEEVFLSRSRRLVFMCILPDQRPDETAERRRAGQQEGRAQGIGGLSLAASAVVVVLGQDVASAWARSAVAGRHAHHHADEVAEGGVGAGHLPARRWCPRPAGRPAACTASRSPRTKNRFGSWGMTGLLVGARVRRSRAMPSARLRAEVAGLAGQPAAHLAGCTASVIPSRLPRRVAQCLAAGDAR